jgi:Protein of unknown function (DUF2924)
VHGSKSLGFLLEQSLVLRRLAATERAGNRSKDMAKKTSKVKVDEPKQKGHKSVKKGHPKAAAQLAVGTKLQKLDRQGKTRCECTVEEGGYRYGKTVFPSLSAAAAAAAKDLGLAGKSFNGYVFWGLAKPGVKPTIERVEQLFRRYSEAALQLSRDPKQKATCLERVQKHVEQLQAVAQ